MLPAHAGMILMTNIYEESQTDVTRTRGDDPCLVFNTHIVKMMLPAHAGMILQMGEFERLTINVTRTRGDDPMFFNYFFSLC